MNKKEMIVSFKFLISMLGIIVLASSCKIKSSLTWVVDAQEYSIDKNTPTRYKVIEGGNVINKVWERNGEKYNYYIFSVNSSLYEFSNDITQISILNEKADSIMLYNEHVYRNDFNLSKPELFNFFQIEGLTYMILSPNRLVSIDKFGRVNWDILLENSGYILNVIGGRDKLFVSTTKGTVFSIEKDKGEILWRVQNAEKMIYSIAQDDSEIYYQVNEKELCAVDSKSGIVKWKTTSRVSSHYELLIIDNNLILPSDEGLFSINKMNGKVNWKLKPYKRSKIIKIDNDKLFVISKHKVTVLDALTGVVLWSKKTDDVLAIYGYNLSRIYGDFILFTKNYEVHCVDALSGTEVWSVTEDKFNLEADRTIIFKGFIFSQKKINKEVLVFIHDLKTGDLLLKISLENLLSKKEINIPKGMSIIGHDFENNKTYYFK